MKNILILFGGNSYEHEISCNSVNFIIENIDTKLFNFKVVGIDFNNSWYEVDKNIKIDIEWKKKHIKRINNVNEFLEQFDIVFPIIHGNTGEDGKIQSLLELNNKKYIGCDSYSSLICYDKLLTKLILEKYNIPQIPYIIFDENTNINNKCGSSIGISIAKNKKELKKAIKIALKYDSKIIIEKFLKKNRELECAILESKKRIIVSDVGEIINNGMWYDYDSKYKIKSETIISNIDEEIKVDIRDYSKKIFKILGCKKMCRIDFLYDLDERRLYFNEVNTIPGFTNISMYPKLIKNEGITSKDLISFLLNY